MNTTRKHRSLFRATFVALLALGLTNRCGLFMDYQGECWTEPAIAVFGGAILGTEGTMYMAQNHVPKPESLFALRHALDPIPEASAAAYCPTLDSYAGSQVRCITPTAVTPYFSEPGPVLQVRYESCKFRNRADQLPGYWYMYHRITFPSTAACAAAKTAADLTTQYTSLVGSTINRGFGMYHPNQTADQHNFRLAGNNEVSAIWTDFPSGWYDSSPQGGVDVTFGAGGTRTLTIKGVHATGYLSLAKAKFKDTADGTAWNFLDAGTDFRALAKYQSNLDYRVIFDHTIDSPKDGETKTAIADLANKKYATITVTGTGANRKITAMPLIRIQHNVANTRDPRTLQVTSLPTGETLDWSNDANCCWPTKGRLVTNFLQRNGRNPRPDWKKEEITFTKKCGVVDYKVYLTPEDTGGQTSASDYSVTHTLSQCY